MHLQPPSPESQATYMEPSPCVTIYLEANCSSMDGREDACAYCCMKQWPTKKISTHSRIHFDCRFEERQLLEMYRFEDFIVCNIKATYIEAHDVAFIFAPPTKIEIWTHIRHLKPVNIESRK